MNPIPPSSPEEGPAITLRGVLVAIYRRKLLFLAVLALAVAAAVYLAQRWRFTYQSSFALLVRPGVRERFDPVRATLQGVPLSDGGLRRSYIEDAAEILSSRDLIDRLVEALVEESSLPGAPEDGKSGPESPVREPASRLDPKLAGVVRWLRGLALPPAISLPYASERERQLEMLRTILSNSVVIAPVRSTTVIRVVVNWRDPVAAHEIARALVRVCQDFYRDTYPVLGEAESREERVAALEKALAANKEAQANTLLEANVSDLDAAIATRQGQIAQLEGQFIACEIEIAANAGQTQVVGRELKTLDRMLPARQQREANSLYGVLMGHLLSLKQLRLEESRVRGDQSPIERRIQEIERELAGTEPTTLIEAAPEPNPLFGAMEARRLNLEIDTVGTREKCSTIQRKLEDLQLATRGLMRKREELTRLEKEAERIESDLVKERQALRAAQAAAGEVSSLLVFEQPRLQPGPANKNRRPMILAGGLIGGLGAAMLLCLLLYRSRRDISGAAELREVTGVRVLAVVPDASRWNLRLLGRGGRG